MQGFADSVAVKFTEFISTATSNKDDALRYANLNREILIGGMPYWHFVKICF